MIYYVVIQDGKGTPVGGALLTFTNAAGGLVGTVRTGADGMVQIDDTVNAAYAAQGVTFSVSAPGFKTDSGWAISDLDPTYTNLIVMVPGIPTVLWVGGITAGALLLASLVEKKKKHTVGGFWDGVDNKVKIALLLGGGFAVYYFLSKDNKNQQLPIEAKAELDQLAAQGIKPTISVTQADAYSNSLTAAFAGCGTDENTVYQVFSQLQNKADLIMLIYVYGVRSYQGCFEGMIWEENVTANLAQALSNELSAAEIGHVNSILSGNGINFSF